MTDNEIIKAFESCNGFESCPDDCPYYSKEFKKKLNCLDEKEGIMAKALDLINRQKAEIESLRKLILDSNKEIERLEAKADFVEVVKCKDCRYWDVVKNPKHKGVGICVPPNKTSGGYCTRRGATTENDYCSQGERRIKSE